MSSRKIGLNLVVIVALAALFTGIWALYNRPVSVPDWPERISGLSFSPFRLNQNPQSGRYPSAEQMRTDLELVARHTHSIRTYSVQGALGDIPALAEAFGLRVSLGIWLGPDLAGNEAEIARAIRIANESPSVVRVIVGNEALFRREVTAEQLIAYLDRVRAAVKVPVTTAEQWHVYREHPELAQHVDLIAAHVLPYWEATPVADAVDFVLERARELKAAFPRKPLLLAEVGWPSNGRMRGSAEATPADQAIYLRRLTNALNGEGYSYFVIEAFDQPWKVSAEGSVGAYWGVYNADRKAKFNFTGPVVPIPKWRALAIASAVLAVLAFTLLLIDSSSLRQRGRTFLAVVSFACASVLVWIAYDYSQQYSTWFSLTVGALLGVGAPLEGFKAGALNFALGHVAADVEVVAVIDADYCVDPDWLRHMVPHFGDPRIAVVQSPQDYRDQHESAFKRLCYAEYKGFFHIGMVTRNDRDAIIEHGTMTMIRRSVLDELRWPEWCITEDAELGLRVFEKGLSAAYFERSYGKGVMPDTFIDFKKQRFRWAYGAIQIMKRHTDALLRGRGPDGSRLTRGQRYHFVAGWLPWIADGLNIFFTLGALLWSAAMIIVPKRVDPPLLIFAILPLALFVFKVGKILFLYRRTVGVDLRDSFFAALAGLSLSHTIAKAVLYGFVTRGIPFFRTPKMRSSHGLLVALAEAREEVFVMLLLWGAAAGIVAVQGVPSRDLLIWVAMLLVQSLPYLAALVMALLSSLPKPREELAGGAEQIGG